MFSGAQLFFEQENERNLDIFDKIKRELNKEDRIRDV